MSTSQLLTVSVAKAPAPLKEADSSPQMKPYLKSLRSMFNI